MDNEILQQILTELKDLKQYQVQMDKNQAVMEKAISEIRSNTDRVSQMPVRESLAILERGMARMETEISTIKEDIEVIKEHTEITRASTNILVDWADRTEHIVNVPLRPIAK